jgi:transcriptional regulator with XRE-family HTH domain
MMDATEIDASFGAWVSRRRRFLQMTQADLAEQTHCSLALIRKIERDERRPSREVALLLATALQVPAAEQARFVQAARGEQQTARLPAVERMAMPAALANEGDATIDGPTGGLEEAPALHLPVPATPLIGRAAEAAKLRELLAQPACRLLTIVGPGGWARHAWLWR